MAWLDIFTGIDSEAEQARGDALDAALRAQAERDRLKYGDDYAAQEIAHINAGATPPDVGADIQNTFWTSIQESPITNAAKTALPPQLLWAAVIGIFLWAGGAGFLKGILKK